MDTAFDIRSLGLSAVVLAVSMTAAMWVLFQSGQRDRKLLLWFGAGVCFVISMGTLAFFWDAPRSLRLWFGNFSFLLGILLLDFGIRDHVRRPVSLRMTLVIVGTAAVGTQFAGWFAPNLVAAFALYFGAALGWGAWLVLKAPGPELRRIHLLLGGVIGAFLLALQLRLLMLSVSPGTGIPGPTSFAAVFPYVMALGFLALLQLGLMALVHREQTLALERLVRTDPLTGVGNRRSLAETAPVEWERARRFSEPLSLMVMDVDRFKSINDEHGHALGDAVLAHLGSLLRGRLRSIDHIFRIGGEEFLMLLPMTDLVGAHVIGETLRQVVEASPCPVPGGALPVTVSLGIGSARLDDEGWEGLFRRVDAALYRAKEGGRNLVVVDG